MEKEELVIAWIGSPSTSIYLKEVIQVMETMSDYCQWRDNLENPKVNVEHRSWNEDFEVSDLLDCDVGIMPLLDDQWSRGKCAYKLIQYMACGLPVIASPVCENVHVVDHDANGLLASEASDWTSALTSLANEVELRQEMGEKRRDNVLAQYTVHSRQADFVSILKTV